jgi:hypothetical protein
MPEVLGELNRGGKHHRVGRWRARAAPRRTRSWKVLTLKPSRSYFWRRRNSPHAALARSPGAGAWKEIEDESAFSQFRSSRSAAKLLTRAPLVSVTEANDGTAAGRGARATGAWAAPLQLLGLRAPSPALFHL